MRSLIWSTTQIPVHQLYNRHFFPKIIYLRHAWRSWITCNRELRCPASQVASCCLWPYLWSTNTSFYSCLIVRLKSRHQEGAQQVRLPSRCLWLYLWSTNTSFHSCLIARLKSRHQSGGFPASQVAELLSLTIPLKHKYFFSFLFDSMVKINHQSCTYCESLK